MHTSCTIHILRFYVLFYLVKHYLIWILLLRNLFVADYQMLNFSKELQAHKLTTQSKVFRELMYEGIYEQMLIKSKYHWQFMSSAVIRSVEH